MLGGCQSCGGAATSGRGLSGRQVAAALAAVAARPRNGPDECVDRDCDDTVVFRNIDSCHYDYQRVLDLTVPGKEGEAKMVRVYEYAPKVFCFLRRLYDLDDGVFADEWALPEDRLSLELGEGRSMAFFLKSKSMNLISKTIAEEEADVLLSILRQYVQHIVENKDTLLVRFLMLLRVTVGEEVGFILCCGDVFSCCRTLNEKWDLKGRVPKPGRYQHFQKLIKRLYECKMYGTAALPENVNTLGSSDVGADCVAVDKYKLVTRKDKDLSRLFWLEGDVRSKLLTILERDYEFLSKAKLMDYSILIGVAYKEEVASGSVRRIESMRVAYPIGSESHASFMEVRPSSQLHWSCNRSEFSAGILSLREQEVYFIGIIDVLTKYTWKKKAANFFKSFLWKSETLSTIPPVDYQNRIFRYSRIIFPDVSSVNYLYNLGIGN